MIHLIDACRRRKDINTVIELVNYMLAINIVPNELTFLAIIDAYGKKVSSLLINCDFVKPNWNC